MRWYLLVTALCFSLAKARRPDEGAINPRTPSELRNNDSSSSPLLPKDVLCGERTLSDIPARRIVGGRNATRGEYPSVVALQFNGKHECGGTIVDKYHVVTAAHCLLNVTAEDVTIVAGAHTFKEANAKLGESGTGKLQIIGVKAFHVHPKYDITTGYGYDFAVLSLKSALKFTDRVQPSCLWGAKDRDRLDGVWAETVGWGRLEEGKEKRPEVLQTVTVPIIPQRNCIESLSEWYEIVNTMICAGSGRKDACRSDSGGPLYILHEGRAHLAGIVSYGVGCGREGLPGVYARVSEELEWIASQLIPEEEGTNVPPKTSGEHLQDILSASVG